MIPIELKVNVSVVERRRSSGCVGHTRPPVALKILCLVFIVGTLLFCSPVSAAATVERVVMQIEKNTFSYTIGADASTTTPTTTTPATTTTTVTTTTSTTTQAPAVERNLSPGAIVTGTSAIPLPLFQGSGNAQRILVQLPLQPTRRVTVTFDALVSLTELPTLYAGTNPFAPTTMSDSNTFEGSFRNASSRFASRRAIEIVPREVTFENTTQETLFRIVTVWARTFSEVYEVNPATTTATTTTVITTTSSNTSSTLPNTTTTAAPSPSTTGAPPPSTPTSSYDETNAALYYAYVGPMQIVARVTTEAAEMDVTGRATEGLPGGYAVL